MVVVERSTGPRQRVAATNRGLLLSISQRTSSVNSPCAAQEPLGRGADPAWESWPACRTRLAPRRTRPMTPRHPTGAGRRRKRPGPTATVLRLVCSRTDASRAEVGSTVRDSAPRPPLRAAHGMGDGGFAARWFSDSYPRPGGWLPTYGRLAILLRVYSFPGAAVREIAWEQRRRPDHGRNASENRKEAPAGCRPVILLRAAVQTLRACAHYRSSSNQTSHPSRWGLVRRPSGQRARRRGRGPASAGAVGRRVEHRSGEARALAEDDEEAIPRAIAEVAPSWATRFRSPARRTSTPRS